MMMVKLVMMLGMSFMTSNGPIKCHQVVNVALARSTRLKIMPQNGYWFIFKQENYN
jgi:hypothetical protein